MDVISTKILGHEYSQLEMKTFFSENQKLSNSSKNVTLERLERA